MNKKETGRMTLFIRHSLGFHGFLRPAYDSAPDFDMELTDAQLRTLRRRICSYLNQCERTNAKTRN